MVSVSDLLSRSFGTQLRALEKRFLPHLQSSSPEAAFVHYVFATLREDCRPHPWPDPIAPAKLSGGMAPDLATAGFLAALNSSPATTSFYPAWRESFARLRDKDPFPLDRLTFTLRPVEFLGICLGARVIGDPETGDVTWLRSLLPEQRRLIHGQWSSWLSSGANVILSDADDSRETVNPQEVPLDELALVTWLRLAPAFAQQGFWKTIEPASLQRPLLLRSATTESDALEPTRAALLYATLKTSVLESLHSLVDERWQVSRAEKDAFELVTQICRRFHRMAQQLRNRHDNRPTLEITDEYDVQDLMHAILLLFFDDVREETWTPNYAGNSSRTDFVLWKECLVVEVKMTRKSLKQKDIANQLIIDKERYKADPRCKTLVCFVYDPGGFCSNPAALESDLSQPESPRTRVIVFSSRG
jgi:hypothetical protein